MKEEGGVRYSDKHTKRYIFLHLLRRNTGKSEYKSLVNVDNNKGE